MHISFARPAFATRDEVPAELVASEREILAKLPEVASKPPEVQERIVEGMLNKRLYAESVLGEQAWIHDTGLTVAKALAQGGLELVDYTWLSVG
jgi:elongation factor Ts